jgi:hypothetical protein
MPPTTLCTVEKLRGELQLLQEWEEWNHEFPGKWSLVTLTTVTSSDHGGMYQLRLWFGEPHGYSPCHVDSNGHHLAIHICDTDLGYLVSLVEKLLKNYEFERFEHTKTFVHVWRLLGNDMPSHPHHAKYRSKAR